MSVTELASTVQNIVWDVSVTELASTVQNIFCICKSAVYYQQIFLSIDTRHNAVNFILNP